MGQSSSLGSLSLLLSTWAPFSNKMSFFVFLMEMYYQSGTTFPLKRQFISNSVLDKSSLLGPGGGPLPATE